MTDIEDFGPGHLRTKSVQMGELSFKFRGLVNLTTVVKNTVITSFLEHSSPTG